MVAKGYGLLNVSCNYEVASTFKGNAFGNVGMLQDFLRTFFEVCGVRETSPEFKSIVNDAAIDKTLELTVESKKGRLQQVLEGIAAKSRGDHADPLILPYYLVHVILTAPIEELRDGISKKHLHERIRSLHHRANKDTIRIGDVTHLLKQLPVWQAEVHPPFLYFDTNSGRLRIVDAAQFFVLSRVDREAMRAEIVDPLERYED